MALPKVTICIPHYMRKELLTKCLWAIKKNVRIPYHVIIINDSKRPLFFNDRKITVINNLERKGLSAARQQFLELVNTEYLFFLDDDVIVLPNSLEFQIEALDNYPELAAVSGLLFSRFKLRGAANFEFEDEKVIKRKVDATKILSLARNRLFFADFIPIGHTSFRISAVKTLKFDPEYKMGYEHWDFFMQLYFTRWKCAVHTNSIFIDFYRRSPKEYHKERFRKSVLNVSKEHFIRKWGYTPVEPKETRKEIIARLIKNLPNILPMLTVYSKVLFNYPLIG